MSDRILVVDDEPAVCELLEVGLGKRGFRVTWRTSGEEAIELLRAEDVDAVVTDLTMQGMDGLELCRRIAEERPDLPVVVITAFGSLDTATAAIRAGAYDFITKPFETDALKLTLERAVGHRALREEVKRLRRAATGARGYEEILSESPSMRGVFDVLGRLADADTPVLLTGESGTGKELVARALHQRSRRRGGSFVIQSCAAVPEALLEGELFGRADKGAPGGKGLHDGAFQRAHGGTLLLGEIADLPLGLQAKLARALSERAVPPLGAARAVPFDVRVLAASHRDLETAIEDRRFREDLYYRINVVRLDLPPLRSRGTDVLLLAQHFLKQFAASKGRPVTGLSTPAAEKLMAYPWPGNVPELQSSIERAVTLARYDQLLVDDLPEKVRGYSRAQLIVASEDPADLVSMDEVERRYVARVLEAVGGNKTRAAQILGFDRATLYRKIERYGIRSGG